MTMLRLSVEMEEDRKLQFRLALFTGEGHYRHDYRQARTPPDVSRSRCLIRERFLRAILHQHTSVA